MATRRKKPSTRVRAKQRAPKKKTPPKARAKVTKRVAPKSRPKQRPVRKPALKKRAPKKTVRKAVPKKRVSKKVLPPKKAKRTPKKKVVAVKPQAMPTVFEKLRARAVREKRMVMPAWPKRMGRTPLRGTSKLSKQRDYLIGQYWQNVRQGWLEMTARRIYSALLQKFRLVKPPPTLYARFTFSLNKIRLLMAMGSPKLIKAKRDTINAWFVTTPVAYTLEAAMARFETTTDNITSEVALTKEQNPKAEFFLEYVTFVAYEIEATS